MSKITADLNGCIKHENKILAQSLGLLAELENSKDHIKRGYPSLFAYCQRELCLSEGSIARRIQVARKIRRYPLLLQLIRDSKMTLTTASMLCPHLEGQSNAEAFLIKFKGKSKRQAEAMLLAQEGDVTVTEKRMRDRISPQGKRNRQVTQKRSKPCPASVGLFDRALDTEQNPLSSEFCYRMEFTAGQGLKDKIDLLKNRLSHQNPGQGLEFIFEKVIDLLVDKTNPRAKRKPRATNSDFAKLGRNQSRYIPVKTRETVFQRARSRCEFLGHSAQRCESRAFLQIDHKRPLSMQGVTEVENLQLLCSAHHQLKTRKDHGEKFIQHKVDGAR